MQPFLVWKIIGLTYSVCAFLALGIQHDKHRIMSSVGCPVLPYFSTLDHKRHDFRKNCKKHEMCVLIFSTNLSEAFLILMKIKRDIIINIKNSLCEVPVILVRF